MIRRDGDSNCGILDIPVGCYHCYGESYCLRFQGNFLCVMIQETRNYSFNILCDLFFYTFM
jgi:hypothetical protein